MEVGRGRLQGEAADKPQLYPLRAARKVRDDAN